jgi:hypothetical protein
VTVRLALLEGYTAADAELDSDAVLGDHKYSIEARSERLAVERALDRFHQTVPIGLLEAVEVSAQAESAKDPRH